MRRASRRRGAITPSCLSFDYINAFHTMLHRQFSLIKGGYSVEIGSKGQQFPPVDGEPWIQIVHEADAKHWLVLACGFFGDVKTVFILVSSPFPSVQNSKPTGFGMFRSFSDSEHLLFVSKNGLQQHQP